MHLHGLSIRQPNDLRNHFEVALVNQQTCNTDFNLGTQQTSIEIMLYDPKLSFNKLQYQLPKKTSPKWQRCDEVQEEERLVDICIASMLYEYHPYLKNLQIPSFIRLVEASRRTSMSVKKPSKGSSSQTISTPRQPWKQESKNVEVAVVEEPKKAAKGRKRERNGISPSFSVSGEELYNIFEAWVKDGVVVLPECKREPTEEEK
ncbi:hypothetical protein SO802_009883 [Lithocarpus litseifolius]|uniref:Uncharacterized protein n=1 Tax=Lithocarpus litseifolius TaxID=425828 RepID=A0AAW2DDA7_9ROSI